MDNNVANIIASQIGNRAFFMIGAKNLLGSENALQFKVGKNAKGVTHITVTLDADDTYTVTAVSCRGTRPIVAKGEFTMVYADQLRSIIEALTGMYTSL